MNERIRELAVQIGFPIDYENPAWAYEKSIYKFAELIVGECARVAAATPCPYTDETMRTQLGHTWDMACVASDRGIRQHFKDKE